MAHLNDEETYLDLLIKWNYPILLVVGMKLGCLNHALLTESILSHNNLPIVGWVANQIEPSMLCYQENLEYLTHKLTLPLLATINYQGQLQPSTPFKEFFHCH
jgi:dethiobiotin synthetase